MKIRVGIVGYGNLGKAVEKCAMSDIGVELVAIFSRRQVASDMGVPVVPYGKICEFVGKIDVMLLCGGSKQDLEVQTPEVLQHFDCINTFDTHARLESEFERLGAIAKQCRHRLVMATGWDPGLFSVIRAYDYAVSGVLPITFWGKGISMGHSDAIRKIEGVKDAVQFTVPIPEQVERAKHGAIDPDEPRHYRRCYVSAKKSDMPRIEREIVNMPNYFKGQPTTVRFVSAAKVAKLKEKMFHRGEIVCSFRSGAGSECKINFSAQMESNPDFTASIVLAYARAVINLAELGICGAFTPLDIPPKMLFLGSKKEAILRTLC